MKNLRGYVFFVGKNTFVRTYCTCLVQSRCLYFKSLHSNRLFIWEFFYVYVWTWIIFLSFSVLLYSIILEGKLVRNSVLTYFYRIVIIPLLLSISVMAFSFMIHLSQCKFTFISTTCRSALFFEQPTLDLSEKNN